MPSLPWFTIGVNLGKRFKVVIELRIDFVAVGVQLPQSIRIAQHKLLARALFALQHGGLFRRHESAIPVIDELRLAFQINHAGSEGIIGEQVYLVLDTAATAAWDIPDKVAGNPESADFAALPCDAVPAVLCRSNVTSFPFPRVSTG